ncbi:MAG: formylglycine-generating enzyme family protein [Desulfobacteraceae bacterium]|mgnify:FL=1|jgi:formylglycine-generating enzyme required for sulfatase activity|nr:formylglycine-generating enzyme family protein [Desulfobacteraceae bacterium]
MKFVPIPAGKFVMGSPPDESYRGSDENQYEVRISKPFYMQTTEVSQGQWKKVMGNNPSGFKDCGDDCPVESVSWEDAQKFISKLNQMEGTEKYRLPTEAEWEYACRAETKTPFFTGDCISTDQANYDGNYPAKNCPKGQYRGKTIKAGRVQPHAWGLYDMHGNVWEWVQDWYGDYPSNSVPDPKGPDEGQYRVLRGGSWNFNAWFLRSADRYWDYPDIRYFNNGFRVARDF